MLQFTLDDEDLIWGFFEELNISPQDLFLEVIHENLKIAISKENEFWEQFDDELQDFIGECGIRNFIEAEGTEEYEEDESTGTWGYFEFEIIDEDRTKDSIEKELKNELAKLVKKLNKAGRFKKYK